MNDRAQEIVQVLKDAQAAFVAKDYELALEKYRSIESQMDPDAAELPLILIEIGWCYYLLRNYPYAIAYLEKAAQSPHIDVRQMFDCLRLCGFAHEFTGNTEKAIAFLKDALLQPVEETMKRRVYFELGKIFFIANQSIEGKEYLEKALALFDENDADYIQSTRYYLGFIAFYESEYNDAEIFFQQIVQNAPNRKTQAPGHFGLAYINYQHKEFQDLVTTCETVMDCDPEFYDKETIGFFFCKAFMELEQWDRLALFLPRLTNEFSDGRYQSLYAEMERALWDNFTPPDTEGNALKN